MREVHCEAQVTTGLRYDPLKGCQTQPRAYTLTLGRRYAKIGLCPNRLQRSCPCCGVVEARPDGKCGEGIVKEAAVIVKQSGFCGDAVLCISP